MKISRIYENKENVLIVLIWFKVNFHVAFDMSAAHHTQSSIEPHATTIICDTDDESEPKTILEIGGISRPIPTYPTQSRNMCDSVLMTDNNNHSLPNGSWLGERTDIVPSPHRACSEFQEHKIVRVNNSNWNPYKTLMINKLDGIIEPSTYFTVEFLTNLSNFFRWCKMCWRGWIFFWF